MDRGIYRVDFAATDADLVEGLSSHAIAGTHPPIVGQRVFLLDSLGNCCFARIHSVDGPRLRFKLDHATWVSRDSYL